MSDTPDFSEFADWRRERFIDQSQNKSAERSRQNHQALIERNVSLLLDREAWQTRVAAFESELAKIRDTNKRKLKRDEFVIMFASAEVGSDQTQCDFRKFVFPCEVNFSNTVFSNSVNFFNATFMSKARFRGTRFTKSADFTAATFSSMANFSYAEFSRNAHFEGCTFHQDGAFFNETKIRQTANFKKTTFEGEAKFQAAHFGSEVTFAKTEFVGRLIFDRVGFHGHAVFDEMVCRQRSTFLDATFKGAAQYFGCSFAENVGFIGARFENKSFFTDVNIKGDANFRGVRFDRFCQFAGATIEGATTFSKAQFMDGAGFQNTTFSISAFLFASFSGKIPDFRNSKFERPPSVSGISILPPRFDHTFQLNPDLELVEKFRVLKSMAASASDHEKEGQFFAMEMAAKRGTEITAFGPLFLSWLYMTFSNFGQSYVRPLWGILGLWCLAFSLFLGLQPANCSACNSPWTAAELATRNLIPFVGSLLRFTAQPDTHSFRTGFQTSINEISRGLGHNGYDLFIYLGFAEQFLGSILLFLLLLGLRNVFRMK